MGTLDLFVRKLKAIAVNPAINLAQFGSIKLSVPATVTSADIVPSAEVKLSVVIFIRFRFLLIKRISLLY